MSAERRVFAIQNRNRPAPLHSFQLFARPPNLVRDAGEKFPLFQFNGT